MAVDWGRPLSRPRTEQADERRRAAPTAEQAAWLAALPATLVMLLAILVLGPPLGGLAFESPPLPYWPEVRRELVHPEDVEHARYAIAVAAPLVLVALTWLLLRRSPPLANGAALARAAEAAAALALAGCFVAQWAYVFPRESEPGYSVHYFTAATLLAAAAIAGAIVGALRSPWVRARWAAGTRSRPAAAAAWLAAVAAIAVAVLPALQTDGGIAAGNNWILYHVQFTFDETLAVRNGRSPLGDFATQYAALWPYVLAGGMSVLGASLAGFTAQLALLTGAAMLALFDLLRRVTRSALVALLLFLPLLATIAFRLDGAEPDRFALANYYGTMPLRYGAPFLLAWLTARHLDGAWPRRAWPLFLAAGLTALNNAEMGLSAFGATGAALLVVRGLDRQALLGLAREAGAGLVAALALVTALLLVRTGSPPDFSLLVRYGRVFASGFAMAPIRPVVGVSTVLFLTYVGAIGVAFVRRLDGRDPLLTGLLMWSGVFGLGAGAYYAGQSAPEGLIQQLPPWALAVMLLTMVAVRRLAARPRGLPTPAEAACLFGFGLLACSLAQLPAPWSQLERLGRDGGPALFSQPIGERFVERQTRPGEPVLILTTLGHDIAEAAGVENVEPYTGTLSLQTREQLADSVRALREAGGRKLFVLEQYAWSSQLAALGDTFGFTLETVEPEARMQMWVRR